jgi:hypothetical protein
VLENGYYSISEISEALGVPQSFIDEHKAEINKGIPFHLCGEEVFFCRDLQRWIERNKLAISNEQAYVSSLAREL